MKKFKYKAIFDAFATVHRESFKNFEANASIEELKELRSLLPTNAEIKENDDLLYCSFNLAVVNLANLNNHGIMTDAAIAMSESFKMRPMNIEHNRMNNCGVITNVGFSSFPDNKIITAEEASESKKPFNICIGAAVWKIADPWFASYLEDTNNENDKWAYKKISTSWEVGFDEFVIARGSKNFFDAEVITDEKEVKRLSKYLTQLGGNGFDDKNKEVYMVIAGKAKGLGGGFTSNPAAAVSGIFIVNPEEEEDEEDDTEDEDEMEEEDKKQKCSASIEVSANKIEEKEKIISQPIKKRVKTVNPMKFKDIDDFCDKYAEASAKNEVVATSDVREFIKDSIVKSAEGWQSKLTEQAEKAQAAQRKIDEMQAAMDIAKEDAKTNATSLEAIRQELEEVKAKADEASKRQVFDSRMSDLDSKYELTDKVRSVITKSIIDKNDDQFAEWLSNEGEVILAGKEKKAITPEEGLQTASASVETIPNASGPTQSEEKALKPQLKREGGNFVVSL